MTAAPSDSNTRPEAPWHEAFPPPKNSSPDSISRADLLQSCKDGKKAGKDFVLVDLRRIDHEVRFIITSIGRDRNKNTDLDREER